MRVLGASVLVMESLTLGFAILLATKDHSSSALIYGGVIAILLFLAAGLLKRRSGFYIASVLQIFMIAFGFAVPSFFIMGGIFIALWAAAIIVGRKGEAARAALMASQVENS
ncbi:MAG: DUF4233 domain-containing protein [Actinobacteria bacterium]|uniref:Unannotated protein n=1 Tax=freshwater metagenome TaxID=449393 RepID=A0A6J7B1I8_9ZZZZ|nr:DUF4233 domain-containing protein [Actinomycetota bacterium]MSY35706.1 DUF4233 domain-containing protein [Actinomycetota bacterium]MTA72439.1 DUF4233 domain-containing protein [Actinomycetota bacterium]MTB29320.1 DUF4233 domain-containing protein [Actinomycetota bacterium]MUH49098.1 DUF4233 domain-containing protein [Actinomycetota bacterium]